MYKIRPLRLKSLIKSSHLSKTPKMWMRNAQPPLTWSKSSTLRKKSRSPKRMPNQSQKRSNRSMSSPTSSLYLKLRYLSLIHHRERLQSPRRPPERRRARKEVPINKSNRKASRNRRLNKSLKLIPKSNLLLRSSHLRPRSRRKNQSRSRKISKFPSR